ncbi:chloramphenicol acetyltransferase CAT [Curtobacterium sp. 'Ferrero']|uniref:CatA-like O-acetyltransferase n=1 Tax=Curtobacterium sp. 'Ferrero' TaxID=2033654 RepID=UPI000BD1899A|nr:CatA-like O-acetyltransferase [Curtobacterium sp. 'Ferrero']PCN48587.1 chloramphenicol acetyltransferase CAT [Curtobacterium sp. 'Ferrero']
MTALRPVDLATWPRREHFAHYRDRVPCTWEMTVELDVTDFAETVRRTERRTYASQIWAIASVVNRHEEFRMQLLEDGSPAVWDVVHPMFTVFHPDTETFSVLFVPYDDDPARFHAAAVSTMERYRDDHRMFPQPDRPRNVFDVSTLPGASFTGFALHVKEGFDHLLPVFTIGRYRYVEGRTMMPIAVQANHAAVDGFHGSRLFAELQTTFAEAGWLRD